MPASPAVSADAASDAERPITPRSRGAAKASALLAVGVVACHRRQLFGRASNGSAFSGRGVKSLLGIELAAPRSGGQHKGSTVYRGAGGDPEDFLSGVWEAGMEVLNFGARFAVALMPAVVRQFSKPLPARRAKAVKAAAGARSAKSAKKLVDAKVVVLPAAQQGAGHGPERAEGKTKGAKKARLGRVVVLPAARRRVERSRSPSEDSSWKPALRLEGGRSGGGRGVGRGMIVLLALDPKGSGSGTLFTNKGKKAQAHHEDAARPESPGAGAAEPAQASTPRKWRLVRDKLPSTKRLEEEDSRAQLHGDGGRKDLHELFGGWADVVPVVQDISGGDPGMSSDAWGGLDADRVARWLATAPAKFDIFVNGEDEVELDRLVLDSVDEWLSDGATSSDASEEAAWENSFDMSEGDDPRARSEAGEWELMVSDSVGKWLTTRPLLYFSLSEDDLCGEAVDWERLVSDRVGRWLATQPVNINMAMGEGEVLSDEATADLVSEYSGWDRIGARLPAPAASFDISQGDMDSQPHEILADMFCESNLWRNMVPNSGSGGFIAPLGRSSMPRNVVWMARPARSHEFVFRCGGSLPAALMPPEPQQEPSRDWSVYELGGVELEERVPESSGVSLTIDEDARAEEEIQHLQAAPLPADCQEQCSTTGSESVEEEVHGESAMEPLSMSSSSDACELTVEEAEVEEVGHLTAAPSPVESVESSPRGSESELGEDNLLATYLPAELQEELSRTRSESSLTDEEETGLAPGVLPPYESQQEFFRMCSESEAEEEDFFSCSSPTDEEEGEEPALQCLDGPLDSSVDAQVGEEAVPGEVERVPAAFGPADYQQELLSTRSESEFAEEELWERTPELLGMSTDPGVTAQAVDEVGRWLQGSCWLARYFGSFLERGYDNLAALRNAETDEVNDLIASCGMPRVHAQLFQIELRQLRSTDQQASSTAAPDQDAKPRERASSQDHLASAPPARLVSADKPGVHSKLQAGIEDAAHRALQHVRRAEADAFVELWHWLHGRHLAQYAGGLAEHGFRSVAALEAADTWRLQDLAGDCGMAPGHARLLLRELGRARRPQGELCEADVEELAADAGWSYAPKVDVAA